LRIAYQLSSRTTGKTIVSQLAIAASFWSRFVGWQFRRKPAAGEGLLLVPCNSIHTCFMRFAIDAIFLDRKGTVLDVRRGLRPWQFAIGPRNSHAVIEFAAGAADVRPGEVVRLEATGSSKVVPRAAAFLVD
jgi:uncharacterized membrane protein (UPF0127 family)